MTVAGVASRVGPRGQVRAIVVTLGGSPDPAFVAGRARYRPVSVGANPCGVRAIRAITLKAADFNPATGTLTLALRRPPPPRTTFHLRISGLTPRPLVAALGRLGPGGAIRTVVR